VKTDKVFYVDPGNVKNSTFSLSRSESFHAVNVMRLKQGESIILIDGQGTGYYGSITNINVHSIIGVIEKTISMFGENKFTVNIAPSIIKRNRFETLIEKATELGVKSIQPIIMQHSVKKTINMERCKKIIRSAIKQCKRSYFPILKEPVSLLLWLQQLNGQYFAGLQTASSTLSSLDFHSSKPVNIIIGPEGDFTSSEIDAMKLAGVQFFSLGNRRLRSETAMLSTISIVSEYFNRNQN